MPTGPKGAVAKQYPSTTGRGGYRPGSGPKPGPTLSATQVAAMLNKAKARAKKEGKDVDDLLLDMIYSLDNTRDKLAAIKLWKEYTMAPVSEGGETDKALGPNVYLPEPDPDPAKVVPIKGESNDVR